MGLRQTFVLALALAGYAWATPSYADNEAVYWQGQDKCDTLFDTPASMLPGGSYLTEILETDSGGIRANYTLATGGKLRLTIPETELVNVDGLTYLAARKDLNTRRPLQTAFAREFDTHIVLADVNLTIGIGSVRGKSVYGHKIRPQSLNLKLKAKVRVAVWSGYDTASEADQTLWDRRLCESYHHEFGHILVAAQVLEESQDQWLAIRGRTPEEFTEAKDNFLARLGESILARQDAYHDGIKTMGKVISHSRPYLDLPFSWLSGDSVEVTQP